MDKYYTPETEEFHIGFEFENKGCPDDNWTSGLLNDWSYFDILLDDYEHETDGKFEELYRVKYLDYSDLNELGFGISYGNKEVEMYSDDNTFIWKFEDGTISIAVSSNRNTELNMPIINKEDFKVIRLPIKNKSELKKVLQWIKN